MFAKFKAFPITVQIAIVFLTAAVTTAAVIAPSITVPLIMIVGSIVSAMRIAVFLVEKK